jgi:hypothetical protein
MVIFYGVQMKMHNPLAPKSLYGNSEKDRLMSWDLFSTDHGPGLGIWCKKSEFRMKLIV